MKKSALLTALFLVFQLCLFGQIPVGYYNAIDGKQERELKTALHRIIRNHTFLDFDAGTNLWWYTYFAATDWHPDGYFWDMYSTDQYSTYNGSRQNREHSMPRSWWRSFNGDEYGDANGDLHNLYPSNAAANTAKLNYPLGVVANTAFNNGVTKVGSSTIVMNSYNDMVFEPADQYKGDFARTYMYMVTCYQDYANRWTSIGTRSMLQNNTYPVLNPYALNLLLEWHRQDPVSQKEKDRNDAVQRLQNNRNPFVDFPELAEYIWGSCTSCIFDLPDDLYANTPVIVAPVNRTGVNFGEVQKDSETMQPIAVKGLYLTSNVSVILFGTNANFFNINTSSIFASEANSDEGYPLEIFYRPTEYGEHNAQLIIYGGGISGSYTVYLSGICSASASTPPPVGADFPDLYVQGDVINFRTYAPDGKVLIYNAFGQSMYAEKGTGMWQEFKMPQRGIYIIWHNGKARKVAISR